MSANETLGPPTRTLLIVSALICALPMSASAKKPGGGGGGGKPPENIELCMTLRDAPMDGLISDGLTDGAFTECYNKRLKHYVLLWAGSGGVFRLKDHGATPEIRQREVFFTNCATDVTGLPCDVNEGSDLVQFPMNTQREYLLDANGDWVEGPGDLNLMTMIEGETRRASFVITSAFRWGPGPNAPCDLSDPLLVTRTDADNWIVQTDDSVADGDLMCRFVANPDGAGVINTGYYHNPFRIDLQRK